MEDTEANETLSLNIRQCIRGLQEKFRECPYNFFTESDAHSYLYYYFFRYGEPKLKTPYPPDNPDINQINTQKIKTVLIHREYPTAFRYAQKDSELKRYRLDEHHGTVGHYDMVVLNPAFIGSFNIEQVISKDNEIRMGVKFHDTPLLAAIEFKLLHERLTKKLKKEIEKDFFKLNEALKPDENLGKGQTLESYMIIFNRWGMEEKYITELKKLKAEYDDKIQVTYQPSYYDEATGEIINPLIRL